MARFTAPEKWNDAWFSNLKPIEKLVFLYLVDKCDNAGFFEINQRIDSFLIGISETDFLANLKSLKKTYVESTDGRKIWIKNYLRYQKNLPLNPDNNAHKQIITFIKSNIENFNYDFNYLGANEGLFSPIGKGNIIGKGIGKVKEVGMIEKKPFNTRPSASDFNGLPETYYGMSIELVYRTSRTNIDTETVASMWEIFKVQKLTGEEYHPNEGKVYSYFMDWLKKQNFNSPKKQVTELSEYEKKRQADLEIAKNKKYE